MAGKERAAACRMADKEDMRPCMEGTIAVGRYLLRAVLGQSSAGLMMRANSKAAPVSGGQVRLRAVLGCNGVFPSCQIFRLTDKRAKILCLYFFHRQLLFECRSW